MEYFPQEIKEMIVKQSSEGGSRMLCQVLFGSSEREKSGNVDSVLNRLTKKIIVKNETHIVLPDGTFHSTSEAAVIRNPYDDYIVEEWYYLGVLHRKKNENGKCLPTEIRYRGTKIFEELYHENGRKHRVDGPARINYVTSNNIFTWLQIWYYDGLQHRIHNDKEDDLPSYIEDNSSYVGGSKLLKWCKNDKLHRFTDYAYIKNYDATNLSLKISYIEGVETMLSDNKPSYVRKLLIGNQNDIMKFNDVIIEKIITIEEFKINGMYKSGLSVIHTVKVSHNSNVVVQQVYFTYLNNNKQSTTPELSTIRKDHIVRYNIQGEVIYRAYFFLRRKVQYVHIPTRGYDEKRSHAFHLHGIGYPGRMGEEPYRNGDERNSPRCETIFFEVMSYHNNNPFRGVKTYTNNFEPSRHFNEGEMFDIPADLKINQIISEPCSNWRK